MRRASRLVRATPMGAGACPGSRQAYTAVTVSSAPAHTLSRQSAWHHMHSSAAPAGPAATMGLHQTVGVRVQGVHRARVSKRCDEEMDGCSGLTAVV